MTILRKCTTLEIEAQLQFTAYKICYVHLHLDVLCAVSGTS